MDKKYVLTILLGIVAIGMIGFLTFNTIQASNINNQFELANKYLNDEELEKSIEEYKKVLELNPNHVEARNNLAQGYALLGNIEEAASTLQEGMKLLPKEASFYLTSSNIYVSNSLVLEAVNVLESGLKQTKDSKLSESLKSITSNISIDLKRKFVQVDHKRTLALIWTDEKDNEVELPAEWSVEKEEIGALTEQTSKNRMEFTGKKNGKVKVVAEAGTITKEIELQVSEQVVESIDFIVEEFDSLAIGQELGLEITGLDADGNEMILNPTWKIKKDLGTLTSNNGASNSFTANKVGLETITVEYQGLEQHLKVLIDGEGHVVNFNVVGQGQATISPAKDVYDEGDEITIEAVPEPGWKFIGWEGDINDTINPLNLTIIENLDVTAIFEEEENYELTINREGEGEIIRSSLSDTFAPSENVTLTARPADGWEFARWEGSVNTYTESITVKMDSDKELTAVFRKVEEEVSSPTPAPPTAPPPVQTPMTYTLSTSVNEGGSVNHNGGGSSIKEGTTVTLTATPYDGWEFVRWEGSATGSSSTISITMNENKSVRAIFTKKQTAPTNYSISTSTSGEGSISKNLTGSTFVEGTIITLTASAAPGWEFVGWEGDSTSTSPSISITLTRNMSVVAVFRGVTDSSNEN